MSVPSVKRFGGVVFFSAILGSLFSDWVAYRECRDAQNGFFGVLIFLFNGAKAEFKYFAPAANEYLIANGELKTGFLKDEGLIKLDKIPLGNHAEDILLVFCKVGRLFARWDNCVMCRDFRVIKGFSGNTGVCCVCHGRKLITGCQHTDDLFGVSML